MMHFVSHAWQVEYVEDGTVVTLSESDMQDACLADDLMELFLENGRPRLYLDLRNVRALAGGSAPGLLGLDARVQKAGGQLVLSNVSPALSEALQPRGLQ